MNFKAVLIAVCLIFVISLARASPSPQAAVQIPAECAQVNLPQTSVRGFLSDEILHF